MLTEQNTKDVIGDKQSVLTTSTVNPLVAFNDIHGRKGDVLLHVFTKIKVCTK
jgi:hypothetical protein